MQQRRDGYTWADDMLGLLVVMLLVAIISLGILGVTGDDIKLAAHELSLWLNGEE